MKASGVILFAAGVALMGLNIYGLFRTMRNSEVYNEPNTSRIDNISVRIEDLKKELTRRPGESDREFAIRANKVVHDGMIHYWKMDGIDKYYMRVPAWENYVIYLRSIFKKDKRYEFVRYYRKNLERGVGLCSTHSIVLSGILKDNGIESQFWDITRHVIVRARVSDNEWYILDPNYGLYIPHDIPDIQSNPELVRPTYANMANLYKPDYADPYTTGFLVEIYQSEGNRIYTYNTGFEVFSYIAKWLIPLLLMTPFLLTYLSGRDR